MNFISNNADNILGGLFLVVVAMLFIVGFMIFDSEDDNTGFT